MANDTATAIDFKNVYPKDFWNNYANLKTAASQMFGGVHFDTILQSGAVTEKELRLLAALMTSRSVAKKMPWSSVGTELLKLMWEELDVPEPNLKIFDLLDKHLDIYRSYRTDPAVHYLNFSGVIRALTGRSLVEYVSGRRNNIRWVEFLSMNVAKAFKGSLSNRQINALMCRNEIYTVEELLIKSDEIFNRNLSGFGPLNMATLKTVLQYHGISITKLGMTLEEMKAQYDNFVKFEGAE